MFGKNSEVILFVFGKVFSIIFLTLYIIIDIDRLSKMFYNLIPNGREERVKKFVYRLININGYYIRGNLLISLICGLVIGLSCVILRIPFATSLAIFAGFLVYPAVWDRGADYLNSATGLEIPHFFNIPFKLGLDLQGGMHLI